MNSEQLTQEIYSNLISIFVMCKHEYIQIRYMNIFESLIIIFIYKYSVEELTFYFVCIILSFEQIHIFNQLYNFIAIVIVIVMFSDKLKFDIN